MDFFFQPKYLWDNFLFYIVVTGYVMLGAIAVIVEYSSYVSYVTLMLNIFECWKIFDIPKKICLHSTWLDRTVAITSDYPKKESFSHNLNKNGNKFAKSERLRKSFHIFFLLYGSIRFYISLYFVCEASVWKSN